MGGLDNKVPFTYGEITDAVLGNDYKLRTLIEKVLELETRLLVLENQNNNYLGSK